MDQDITHLFQKRERPLPPPDLRAKILVRIAEEGALHAKRIFAIFSILIIASVVTLVPVLSSLAREITASGLGQYMSLLGSDGSLLLLSWREFTFSLLESLPSLSIALALVVCAVFLLSLKQAVRSARTIFYPLQAF